MCRILILAKLWGLTFYEVVVFGLGKNLLLNSILGRCANLVNVVCERPLIVKWAHSVYKATFPILSHSGNALAWVQQVHKLVYLWYTTFCTR